jgi:hypothetical protein
LARKIQKIIGWPRTRQNLDIVSRNQLRNSSINREDTLATADMFRLDMRILKGKTVCPSWIHVDTGVEQIPSSLVEQCKQVMLWANIMFVSKIIIFVTVSRNIKFCTAQMFFNQKISITF